MKNTTCNDQNFTLQVYIDILSEIPMNPPGLALFEDMHYSTQTLIIFICNLSLYGTSCQLKTS